MKQVYDLSTLKWNLTGWLPYLWNLGQPVESINAQSAEIQPIPATVPGSVQKALLDSGIIEDWNKGTYYRDCQWVENLHWIYETTIPADWTKCRKSVILNCKGLDGSGFLILNHEKIGKFESSFVPYVVDLSSHMKDGENQLQIVFDCPPRWLGQFGYTSEMTDLKTRFYYTWDWTSRLVQTGIWDDIQLACSDGSGIDELRVVSSVDNNLGSAYFKGRITEESGCVVKVKIIDAGKALAEKTVSINTFNTTGATLEDVSVEIWWPNLHGGHKVYQTEVELIDSNGQIIDSQIRQTGFRKVEWKQCEGSAENADPWLCVVNDKPIFIQGANWVPIRPNFADLTEEDYRKRLSLYQELGFNMLRVWGGAVLEKELFYNICDELGILVWQEFPMSSSGCDNYPPEDKVFMSKIADTARSYIARRQHHPSLVIWCGGNELIHHNYTPVGEEHPLLKMLGDIVREEDPSRRYLPSSPSGPKAHASRDDYGKGVHWDVHGPWQPDEDFEAWKTYWAEDDSLFRSETGSPGASAADILTDYAGNCSVYPIDSSNPYWRRHTTWWIDYPKFVAEIGREPDSLEEYCNWSQERQKMSLVVPVTACKQRFPRCGGIMLWMGHDSFPCSANTSVIDFLGRPKAAAIAIGKIFKSNN